MASRSLTSALTALLLVSLHSSADEPLNPRGFPEYEQIVTLRFASAADAASVKIDIPRLPDAEPMAFSTRWDGWKPANIPMAETQKKHGIKGTWYPEQPRPNDETDRQIRAILDSGSSLGSHNMDMISLPDILPSEMFYQIVMMRPMMEARSDSLCTTVTIPNTARYSEVAYDTAQTFGSYMSRGGFVAAPEFWNCEELYHLETNTLFSTHIFDANDRNPSEETFYRGLVNAWGGAERSGTPHVTLGVHCLQNAEGMVVIDRLFESLKRSHPSWWYCNENEYGAYSFQVFHTKIDVAKTEDTSVTLRLRRIAPHSLGSDIPLSLQIHPSPECVMLGETEIARAKSGVYKIPHAADWQIPQRIDFLYNTNNVATAQSPTSSTKFPGLSAGLHWDEATSTLRGFFRNESTSVVSNVFRTLYLAQRWTRDPPVVFRTELLPGTEDAFSFAPSTQDLDPRPETQIGNMLFLVQYDFLLDGKAARLYTGTNQRHDVPLSDCSRDCTVFIGPLAPESLTEDDIAALSNPETPLRPLGTAPTQMWQSPTRPADTTARPFLVKLQCNDPTWIAEAKIITEGILLTAIEFDSTAPAHCRILRNFRNKDVVYLNGQRIHSSGIKPREGRNRILIQRAAHGAHLGQYELSVVEGPDASSAQTVHFIRPTLP